MITLLLALTATAEPDCPPLEMSTIEALAQLSGQAVNMNAYDMHQQAMEQFTQKVPCLRMRVPTEPWARLLVSESILRHQQGGDYKTTLATALHIEPGVGGVPWDLLSDGLPQPPPVPADAQQVPEGFKLFVDGVAAGQVPLLEGYHIVQIETDGELHSAMGSLPIELPRTRGRAKPPKSPKTPKEPRAPREPRTSSGGGGLSLDGQEEPIIAHVGLFGGGGRTQQTIEPEGDYLQAQSAGGIVAGLSGQALIAIPSTPIAGWAAAGLAPGRPGGLEFVLGAGLPLPVPGLTALAGFSGSNVRLVEGPGKRRMMLGQPRLGARYAPVSGADLNVSFGVMPASGYFGFSGGFAPLDMGFAQARAGLDFSWTTARLVQADIEDRTGHASRWRMGLHLGLAWGH